MHSCIFFSLSRAHGCRDNFAIAVAQREGRRACGARSNCAAYVNIPGLLNENSPAGRKPVLLVSFHMEYSPVTSSTAQRFVKKVPGNPPSGDRIRRGQLDPDAGRTGEGCRGCMI